MKSYHSPNLSFFIPLILYFSDPPILMKSFLVGPKFLLGGDEIAHELMRVSLDFKSSEVK